MNWKTVTRIGLLLVLVLALLPIGTVQADDASGSPAGWDGGGYSVSPRSYTESELGVIVAGAVCLVFVIACIW